MIKTIDRGPEPPGLEDDDPRLHLSYVYKTKQSFLRYASKLEVPPKIVALRAIKLHRFRDDLSEDEILAIETGRRGVVPLVNPYERRTLNQAASGAESTNLNPLILTFTGEDRLNLLTLAGRYQTTPTTIGRNALTLLQICDELKPQENLVVFNQASNAIVEYLDAEQIIRPD